MENSVQKILVLFERLDAMEAIELSQELRNRGYNLTVSDNKKAYSSLFPEEEEIGIALLELGEEDKIRTIRAMMNGYSECAGDYTRYTAFTIQTAKSYVELPAYKRMEKPFIIGLKNKMGFVLDHLNNNCGKSIFGFVNIV